MTAIVQWTATPDQRTVIGTLQTLPTLARRSVIGPPATLIVGQVASFGHELAWVKGAADGGQPGIDVGESDTTTVTAVPDPPGATRQGV